jgi:hypothetical protein
LPYYNCALNGGPSRYRDSLTLLDRAGSSPAFYFL